MILICLFGVYSLSRIPNIEKFTLGHLQVEADFQNINQAISARKKRRIWILVGRLQSVLQYLNSITRIGFERYVMD